MSQVPRVCFATGLMLLLIGPANQRASGASAHFWISTLPIDSQGPAVQTVKRARGSTGTFYIWAEPETIGGGAYSGGNLYKELQNLSLNIVASDTGIDFVDGGIKLYNPTLTTPVGRRFQYDYDSTPAGWDTPQSTPSPLASLSDGDFAGSGIPDMISGLEAFSFGSNVSPGYTGFLGLGSACTTENSCYTTLSGAPAWLLASISYKTLTTIAGPVTVNLSIGSKGMNHATALGVTEGSTLTNVEFGTSATVYNALTDRGLYNLNTPDLTIQSCGSITGDYNGNCTVDAADYTVWRDTLGSTTDLRANGDNNFPSNGIIDGADYLAWKNAFGTVASMGSGSLGGGSIPEPASYILLLTGLLAIFAGRRAARS